jgi:tRNA U38,U39,U40 pseudouridine synthase TruA
MVDMATGKRPAGLIAEMLLADHNHNVSPPAPARGLFLEQVRYPQELYLDENPIGSAASRRYLSQ